MKVNGVAGWWRVKLHRNRGQLYARRIRADGRVNARCFAVARIQSLLRLDGRLSHAEARAKAALLGPDPADAR
jgi:hypothetical protein